MEFRKLKSVVVIVSLLTTTFAEKYDEPLCTSRFDFEDKLLNKMVRMEHAMELLQERVVKASTAMELLQERVGKALADMERENLQIKQDVVGFKAGVKDEQTKALEDFKREGNKLTNEIETLSQQSGATLQRMSQDLAVAINKSADDEGISSVVFAVNIASGYTVNGVPTFTKVLVNVGGAYDVSTGKFTCSVKGIYTFTFSVRSTSAGYVFCYIRKNGANITYAISEGNNDMASVTVYLNLVVGDVVDLGSCIHWHTVTNHGVSFSGMKI